MTSIPRLSPRQTQSAAWRIVGSDMPLDCHRNGHYPSNPKKQSDSIGKEDLPFAPELGTPYCNTLNDDVFQCNKTIVFTSRLWVETSLLCFSANLFFFMFARFKPQPSFFKPPRYQTSLNPKLFSLYFNLQLCFLLEDSGY